MVSDVKYLDVRSIPDAALSHLRQLTIDKVLAAAPSFGAWLHRWLDQEMYLRAVGSEDRPAKHLIGLPCPSDWTDDQLGRALRGVTVLSYVDGVHPTLSDLVDRMVLVIVEAAANRLVTHDQR